MSRMTLLPAALLVTMPLLAPAIRTSGKVGLVEVLDPVASYHFLCRLRGAVEECSTWRQLSKGVAREFALAESVLLDDLEQLQFINRTVTEKLHISAEDPVCERCDHDAVDKNFRFKHGFELRATKACLRDLKIIIRDVRIGIVRREEVIDRWLQAMRAMKPPSIGADSFDPDVGCEGKNLPPELMRGAPGTSQPAEAWCRDFAEGAPESVLRSCAEYCGRIDECRGVTWFDQAVDVDSGINGSRCCFRADTSKRYAQEHTRCFVASRPRFLALDVAGAGKWLRRQGFGQFAPLAETFGVNGVILQGLTKSKLREWLTNASVPMSEVEAAELRCRIDAELLGVLNANHCSLSSLTGRLNTFYKMVLARADNFVFAGVGLRGDWRNLPWRVDLLGRLMPKDWNAKGTIGAGVGTFYTLAGLRLIRDAIDAAMGGDSYYSAVWLGVAVAALGEEYAKSGWAQCGILRKTLLAVELPPTQVGLCPAGKKED